MLLVHWTAALSLLLQGCLGSVGDTGKGCRTWDTVPGKTDVCCEICKPGNRVLTHCGPKPEDLCTPCEPGTYTEDPKKPDCRKCTQCVGALVHVKACTSSTDTVCGCRPGLRCGDDRCSFCVKECDIGQEPAEKRSCRKCPDGTFNDRIHQPCKPWRIRCPNPNEFIVAMGDAVSDIKCNKSAKVSPVKKDIKPTDDNTGQTWSMVLWVAFIGMVLIIISTTIVIIVVKILWKGKKTKPVPEKQQIITTPTDDPRTLIAVECSFHEAQQEQGSSSESLASKDSKHQLIV